MVWQESMLYVCGAVFSLSQTLYAGVIFVSVPSQAGGLGTGRRGPGIGPTSDVRRAAPTGVSPTGNHELPELLGDWQVCSNHDLHAVLLIGGVLLLACSRERCQDEYIGQIRLDTLLRALSACLALMALASLLVSSSSFFTVMTHVLFALRLLFVARFQVVLRRGAQAAAHAE